MAEGKSGFGHFKPYGSVDIDLYLRRFNSYLFTRGVVEPEAGASQADKTKYANQRKRWLLAEIGPEAYAVLDGLCGAGAPENKTVTELETLLKTHFKPLRNKNTEREKFYARRQGAESVSEYSVALYQLAKFCEFGDFLDQALQTQFINNLRSVKIKEKVAEGRDNFSAVVADAAKYEQMYASNEAPGGSSGGSIHMLNKKKAESLKKGKKKEGNVNKPEKQTTPKDVSKVRCFNCNERGHYAHKCPQPKKKKDPKKVMLVDGRDNTLELYPVRQGDLDRVPIEVELNGIPFVMELDTAAKASTIDKFVYAQHFPNVPLRKTATLLWGGPLPMLGEFDVEVKYRGQCKKLVLTVVDTKFPSLYGLPWIWEIRPDFESIFPKKTEVFVVGSQQWADLPNELRRKYPIVFSGGTEPIQGFEVSLVLKDGAQPRFLGPRVVAIPLREPTARAIKEMERSQFIEPCEPGPWGTPIVPVRKADNEVRVCGDFSVTLNPHLVCAGRALPLIDDLSVVNGNYFCILDMKMAYLQLRLSPESQELCKLNTPIGTYKCLRMPFGIASAPTAFQEVISTILAGIANIFIYLDDILLWGQTPEECLKVLHEVLARMEKFHVKLNLNKCKFLQESVVYLGFQLDKTGSRPDPARMEELLAKPAPKDHTQLKSFLGMVTFFHKYGPNLASVLQPLYQLKKASKFSWGPKEQMAFEKALELLATTVLVPYSLKRPLRLTTDASPVGAGCVLSHIGANGEEEPIAFASKMFSERELKYPVHEREGVALIFGVKKFEKYLSARSFEIVSDNKALVAIFGEKNHQRPLAAARLQRWQLLLSSHQYTIVHRKSEQIPHADFLSRFPSKSSEPVESEVYWVNELPSELLSAAEVAEETARDPVLKQVLHYVMHGWPDFPVLEELKPFHNKYLELTAENNCLLWNSRVVIPQCLQQKVMELLHETHPGGSRMKALARSYVWWPKLDQQIEDFVKNCGVCQALQSATPHDTYVPWTWPSRRWQRIHMDFGKFEGTDLLVVLDAHSKWPEVRIMLSTTAGAVVEVLRSMFAAYGLPEEVVTDNGPPFSSKEFSAFLQANGVVQTFSPTYHPQSDGAAENEVKSVKRSLKKQLLDQSTQARSLQHKVDAFCFTYRNTPHTVTKVSPAELFLGRRPRTPLSMLQPGNILKMKMKEQQDIRKAKDRAKITVFHPGDLVWVRTITHSKLKWVPGLIESVCSSVSYMVQIKERVRQVSSSHLRPRSPLAETIEEDTAATQVPEGPTQLPLPIPEQTTPELWEEGAAPELPSTPGQGPPTPVQEPFQPGPPDPVVQSPATSPASPGAPAVGTPKRPPVVVKPKEVPKAASPVPVSFSRRGRPIIRPKRLLD